MEFPSTRVTFCYVVCFSLFVASNLAAVFTVDLGSESIKIAVVNPRPGQSPISIAINEMSKRKSPALAALSNGERLVSEEAAGIYARYPERVYSHTRDMIGKPFSSVQLFLKEKKLPYDLTEGTERSTAKIRTHDGQIEYSVEELVAMILSYAREIATSHAKSVIKDAVVSVPPYFGQSQRQALLDAARIADVNIMALIHEHAGAALQYGIDKEFTNGSRDILLYDMGASTTYAAIIHYSSYIARERGKNITANQFQVKAIRWDSSLGGQTMEDRLIDHFAVQFNKKMGQGLDIRKSPKSIAKLRKQVKRTKEILSANTDAPITVESIYDDYDLKSSISREEFENICSDIWIRALNPIKWALADSNLKTSDLDGVELLGGASRVPKLRNALAEFFGNLSLDRHLDADEAISLGSSLFAANLSDGFKLNKKIGMVDGATYAILFKVENFKGDSILMVGNEEGDEGAGHVLFPRLKKLPTKVLRSLKSQTEDLKLTLTYDPSGELPPGIPSNIVAVYEILGVANASEKYSSYNLTHPLKTSLHFSLSRSGISTLDRAETVVEFYEWYDHLIPILPPSNATSNSTINLNSTLANDTSYNPKGKSESGSNSADQSQSSAENLSQTTNSSAGDLNSTTTDEEPKFITKRKLRRRTIRVPLKVLDVTQGPAQAMTEREFSEAKQRMETLKIKETEKKMTAEAKNNLETFIYSLKEKLEYSQDISKVSTEQERESLQSELTEAEDWIYMDGADSGAEEFKSKLLEIKKNADTIIFRLEELKKRPEAVSEGQKYITKTLSLLESWDTSRPWINKTDIEEVAEDLEDFKKWLDSNVQAQSKLALHQQPHFKSSDVHAKIDLIQKQVTRLMRIPRPKPEPAPKAPKSSNKTETGREHAGAEKKSEYGDQEKAESSDDKREPSSKVEDDYVHDELR